MATWPAKINYTTGGILTAAQMNDIGGELNDLYTTAGFAAGKNKIINGDFRINQRSFSSTTTDTAYGFDRWKMFQSGGTSVTYSAQTFTLGTAPVTGYEAANFARIVPVGQSGVSDYAFLSQPIEDVRTFANQTVTISFWAKAASGTPKIAASYAQNFGSGGSPSAQVNGNVGTVTLSTSWARYSVTGTIPSISGKTIGTTANTSYLRLDLWVSGGSNYSQAGGIGIQNNTFDIWGVQLEAGSVATPFQTATGTIQGELAACQRYYWRTVYNSAGDTYGNGVGTASTTGEVFVVNPVYMRTNPSSVDYANLRLSDRVGSDLTVTNLTINSATVSGVRLNITVASGVTASRPYFLIGSASSNYLGFSAEL